MRIAIIFHADFNPDAVESSHAIGLIAEIWRQEGHEVEFLLGCDRYWPADVAVLHVDASLVPDEYLAFARRFPRTVNLHIPDIRKSRISRNLVDPRSGFSGPVIVKTDLNSGGLPERLIQQNLAFQSPPPIAIRAVRRAWRMTKNAAAWLAALGRGEAAPPPPKPYTIYESLREVPASVLARPGLVVEKFLPETDGEWYYTRRCFKLGDRAISYRMGDRQPIVEGGLPEAFEFVETRPEVLAVAREVGLDYGTLDHTIHDGEVVVLDINKTPGRAAVQGEEAQRDYERILRHVAPGIHSLAGEAVAAGALVADR